MFSRKTKIVCSLGPAVDSDELVEGLINAGMNVARFNFSHGNHEEHKARIERVKRCSKKLGVPVALLLDTKGPEIRTGNVPNAGKVIFKKGDTVLVTVDDTPTMAATETEPARLALNWKEFAKRASKGVRVLIADGLLELDVEESDGVTVLCKARNTAEIGSKKNVNLIGVHAGLPIMTETDKADIAFGVSMDVDFVAASFVSFATEVVEIREYLESLGSKAHIIAKIENEEGLDNIEDIIEVADGVMVARGDLGVQLPTERIPLAQKHIIVACQKAGKAVITATQMLDSMIINPRPTRAEVTDVANAILDGTDAVMLSGETANGSYPVEAVETMSRIAITVEESPEYCKKMRVISNSPDLLGNLGKIVAHSAYLTATEVEATVIIVPSVRGNTARMISMFRPKQPILVTTPEEKVQRQLQLNWGVIPLLAKVANDSEEMVQNAIKRALDADAVKIGDRAVMCAGIPLVSPLMANTIRVIIIGTILTRGQAGGYSREDKVRSSGRIVHAETAEEAYMALRKKGGEILVCPSLTDEYIPILRVVDGVICEGENLINPDVMTLINPRLVWISKATDATHACENGLTVTIDGTELIVYDGLL